MGVLEKRVSLQSYNFLSFSLWFRLSHRVSFTSKSVHFKRR